MTRHSVYFLDACIPMYASGGDHPYKEACARIVLAGADNRIEAVTDVEVIQEIAHRYRSIKRPAEGLRLAEEFLSVVEKVLPVTRAEAARSLELQHTYGFLSPRDAIHVAVMLGAGLEEIVTADRHFDRVKEVRRVDPARLRWER